MEPISDLQFIQQVIDVCTAAIAATTRKKIVFRPMQRRSRVDPKRGFVIGRTNLKTGLITIDIFTPAKRGQKKISSILRTLCHEIAHHQKKPYYQRFRGRWIIRRHYPAFYRQVNKNIEKLKKTAALRGYFSE